MPTAGPAIGDTCTVGTWRVLKATLIVAVETPKGVVTVAVGGGAGELDHYFTDGTVVENLAGTAFTGSVDGYRVVLRATGTLSSPVVFVYGRETVEPVDSSAAHLTVSINGGKLQTIPEASYDSFDYTCGATSLTERDTTGDVFTYVRVSSVP